MIINGPWEVAGIADDPNFGGFDNLGVAPVPAGSAGQGAPVGGHNYVIYSGMDESKADAAIAFIKFMSSAESEAYIADELGLLPGNADAYDMVRQREVALWADAMDVAQARPWIPEGGQFFAPLDEMATEVLDPGHGPVAARPRQGRQDLQERSGPRLLARLIAPVRGRLARAAPGLALPHRPPPELGSEEHAQELRQALVRLGDGPADRGRAGRPGPLSRWSRASTSPSPTSTSPTSAARSARRPSAAARPARPTPTSRSSSAWTTTSTCSPASRATSGSSSPTPSCGPSPAWSSTTASASAWR